jgi:glycosyltransferase involved in cell wall biosynthesis
MPQSTLSQSRSDAGLPPLVVSGTALAYTDGGKPAYVYRLLTGLARADAGYPLHLFVPEKTRLEEIPPQVTVTYTPRKLPRSKPIVSEIFTGFTLGKIARSLDPRAILITPSDFWSLRYPMRRLAITHDALPEIDQVSAGSAIRRFFRRQCIRYAKKAGVWATISHFAADELVHYLGPDRKPDVLQNWIDAGYRRPAPSAIEALRQKFGLPEKFILYVGGYSRYKNVECLIRAHALASRSTPLPPLVLAGNVPSLQSGLNPCDIHGEISRSGCAPGSVLLPGYVAEADMPALYSAATLFVSPSLHEGFGYPPVEAMAVGCPVLVSDRSSYQEIVPQAHCRFDPDALETFAQLLIEASNQPARFICPFSPLYEESAGIARYLTAIRRLHT